MFKRALSLTVILCFFLTTLGPLPKAHADTVLGLPTPGTMVNLSPAYEPALIKGLTVHKDNPFLFDFIVDTGHSGLAGDDLKKEGDRLVKYFFACLTIPEKDLWVNLSPYEKDRMVPQALGQTALGRDLLAQDYILKQLTASLIYPEKNLGKEFWNRVYAKAQQEYGTTQIPVNTFNKVWILADKASVYEHGQTAFVVGGHLKVMLEEDYLALSKHQMPTSQTHSITSQIVRQIIIPELEKEVNTAKNFAMLRQIFYSQILATWYKKNLKEALFNQVYADKSTVKGVNLDDPSVKEQIYQQYLKAYKKGVFNYIKEDAQPDGQTIPRKYFSGGYEAELEKDGAMTVTHDLAMGTQASTPTTQFVDFSTVENINGSNPAMTTPDAAMKAEETSYRIGGKIYVGEVQTAKIDEMINALRKDLYAVAKSPSKVQRTGSSWRAQLPLASQLKSRKLLGENFVKQFNPLGLGFDGKSFYISRGFVSFNRVKKDVQWLEWNLRFFMGDQEFSDYVRKHNQGLEDAKKHSYLAGSAAGRGKSDAAMKVGTYTWEKYGEQFRGFTVDIRDIRRDGSGMLTVKVQGKDLEGKAVSKEGIVDWQNFYTFPFLDEKAKEGDYQSFLANFNALMHYIVDPRKYESVVELSGGGSIVLQAGTGRIGSRIGTTPRQFLRPGRGWAQRHPEGFKLLHDAQTKSVPQFATYSLDRLNDYLDKILLEEDSAPANYLKLLKNSQPSGESNLQILVNILSSETALEEFAATIYSLKSSIQFSLWLDFVGAVIDRCARHNFTRASTAYTMTVPVGATVDTAMLSTQTKTMISSLFLIGVANFDLMQAGPTVLNDTGILGAAVIFPISGLGLFGVFNYLASLFWNTEDIESNYIDSISSYLKSGKFRKMSRDERLKSLGRLVEQLLADSRFSVYSYSFSTISERKKFEDRDYLNNLARAVVHSAIYKAGNLGDNNVIQEEREYIIRQSVDHFFGTPDAEIAVDRAAVANVTELRNPGGIDLNTANMGMTVTKDANGGVKVNFDPALIARIRQEGVQSAVPMIINVTPMSQAQIRPLLGLN